VAFPGRPTRVIVLGITPGVRSLAYCVLALRDGSDEPELVDSDLLKGGRVKAGDTESLIKKKMGPHALVLHIVLERAFELNQKEPVLMAIGPGTDKEPAELVFLVRAMLTGLAIELKERGIRIDCINWQSSGELDRVLGMEATKAVRRQLNRKAPDLIRSSYVLAAGTALAAIRQMQQKRAHDCST
jgi:hypothetical protein